MVSRHTGTGVESRVGNRWSVVAHGRVGLAIRAGQRCEVSEAALWVLDFSPDCHLFATFFVGALVRWSVFM